MGSNQHGLAGLELRLDSGLEVRLHTLNNVGQALGFRNRIAGVARVVVLGVLVVRVDLGRRGGVRTAPQHELLVAVLFADLGLVLALQSAVVTLVETPVTLNRNPQTIRGIQSDVGGVDGATQQGGEHDVRKDVLLLEQLAATLGFGFTLLGQRYVDPAGELVSFIPCALSMTEQY